MIRAVAYCRYSSELQRDGYSIEAQVRAIEEYCAREKILLINKYIDEARWMIILSEKAFDNSTELVYSSRYFCMYL